MIGRSVRRCITDLGYVVHSPASVFGQERLERGLGDEDWLPVVGANGWAVFGRDQNILKREIEIRAFLDARVHMFLFPGEATRPEIIALIHANLADICAVAVARRPDVYWLKMDGMVNYERRKAELSRKRRT